MVALFSLTLCHSFRCEHQKKNSCEITISLSLLAEAIPAPKALFFLSCHRRKIPVRVFNLPCSPLRRPEYWPSVEEACVFICVKPAPPPPPPSRRCFSLTPPPLPRWVFTHFLYIFSVAALTYALLFFFNVVTTDYDMKARMMWTSGWQRRRRILEGGRIFP